VDKKGGQKKAKGTVELGVPTSEVAGNPKTLDYGGGCPRGKKGGQRCVANREKRRRKEQVAGGVEIKRVGWASKKKKLGWGTTR